MHGIGDEFNACYGRAARGVADVLAKLANTSSWADADASNYKIVNNYTDVVPDEWFTMTNTDKTVCLGYSNANGGIEGIRIYTKRRLEMYTGERGFDACVYLLPHDVDGDGKEMYRLFKKRGSYSNEETIISVMGDTGQTEVAEEGV